MVDRKPSEAESRNSRRRVRSLAKLAQREATVTGGVRRAWRLVEPATRRRLRLISAFSIGTSVLDTGALLLVYGLVTLLSGSRSLPTGVTGQFIQLLSFGETNRYDKALVLLSITVALFVFRSLLTVLSTWMLLGAVNDAEAGLLGRVLTGYALSPQLQRNQRNSSELLRTLAYSVDQVSFGVVNASALIFSNLATTAAVTVALFLSTPTVALTVIVYFALISVVWTRSARGTLRSRGAHIQVLQAERYRHLMQGFGAAKELQLRGRALFYADHAVATTREVNAEMRGVNVLNGSVGTMLQSALVIGTLLVVAVAGETGGRAAALPAVGLVLAAALRLLPALSQMIALANTVHYGLPGIDLIEQELASFAAVEPVSDEAAVPLSLDRELRLKDVSFRYPTRTRPALRDLSLVIHPRQMVGIVGHTGSGKSTLLDVLLGVIEPDSGEVLLDGEPLYERRAGWQRAVGYVPQDVYLVDDTVSANVALGWRGSDIDEDAVLEAVRLAELDEVVSNLPDGLDTRLGERGIRLSGGQRQRVGIARALYTRPSVLVLDEATSNLDRATESRIVDTLVRLRGGVTMIVVTHRIASVRCCDHLFCLENGRLVGDGTFAEVAEALPDLLGQDERRSSTAAHQA